VLLVTISDIADPFGISAEPPDEGGTGAHRCHRNDTRAAWPCIIAEGCALRKALGAALQACLAVLDRYTLADLIEPRQTLAALLGASWQGEQRIMRPQ
jgi:DNA-binding IscR family transcriptional regulator